MKTTAMRSRDGDGPMMHLDHEAMRRAGLIGARAGDEYEFHGKARIKAAGERDGDSGVDRHCSVEITHMGMEHKGGMSLRDTVSEAAGGKK